MLDTLLNQLIDKNTDFRLLRNFLDKKTKRKGTIYQSCLLDINYTRVIVKKNNFLHIDASKSISIDECDGLHTLHFRHKLNDTIIVVEMHYCNERYPNYTSEIALSNALLDKCEKLSIFLDDRFTPIRTILLKYEEILKNMENDNYEITEDVLDRTRKSLDLLKMMSSDYIASRIEIFLENPSKEEMLSLYNSLSTYCSKKGEETPLPVVLIFSELEKLTLKIEKNR